MEMKNNLRHAAVSAAIFVLAGATVLWWSLDVRAVTALVASAVQYVVSVFAVVIYLGFALKGDDDEAVPADRVSEESLPKLRRPGRGDVPDDERN